MATGWPSACMGTIAARRRPVTRLRELPPERSAMRARCSCKAAGSNPRVDGSLSRKCGSAPQCATALAVATKVSAGISTSSSRRAPARPMAICSRRYH